MTHKNFNEFKEIGEIAIYFVDNLDQDEINEVLNDLYTHYKESKIYNPTEFFTFWLQDLNRSTHDWWLDKRGLMLLACWSRV